VLLKEPEAIKPVPWETRLLLAITMMNKKNINPPTPCHVPPFAAALLLYRMTSLHMLDFVLM
jgi:hypothetical protein